MRDPYPQARPPAEGGVPAQTIIAGRRYAVTRVRASYPDRDGPARWRPMFAGWHEDRHAIDFPCRHFHVDGRFASRAR